jgi:hypothetical protein
MEENVTIVHTALAWFVQDEALNKPRYLDPATWTWLETKLSDKEGPNNT